MVLESHAGGRVMEIKTEALKRCELVTVSGRIDSSTAPELERVLLGLVQSGQKNMVVNLRDTTFISSAGLKALLSAHMKVRKMVPSGEVVLAETPDELRESFNLVGFDRLFKFFDSNLKAVGSF
jgi:anti-sigma B factor antagonist